MKVGPLHVEVAGSGPPLVLLHGFTGSVETLEELAGGLVDRFRTIRVDLLGHGRSDESAVANAIALACRAIDANVNLHIEQGLANDA